MKEKKTDEINYDDRTKQLMSLREEAERQFDRQIVFLSAGGLVFSIGFVKDIIGVNSIPAHKWILVMSWISFALSLILNLISHITSRKAFNYEIEGDTRLSNIFNNCTIWLNWLSVATLLSGLSSLISFALLNL